MTNKRTGKGANRSQPKNALTVADLSPHKHSIPNDPPGIDTVIRVKKRIQITVSNNESQTTSISPSIISGGVPGGLTYWSKMRIEKAEFWLSAASTGALNVDVEPNTAWDQPLRQYSDKGVEANRRAKIGVTLGLLDRARFFNTADTTILFRVGSSEQHIPITCHFVVDLWST